MDMSSIAHGDTLKNPIIKLTFWWWYSHLFGGIEYEIGPCAKDTEGGREQFTIRTQKYSGWCKLLLLPGAWQLKLRPKECVQAARNFHPGGGEENKGKGQKKRYRETQRLRYMRVQRWASIRMCPWWREDPQENKKKKKIWGPVAGRQPPTTTRWRGPRSSAAGTSSLSQSPSSPWSSQPSSLWRTSHTTSMRTICWRGMYLPSQ